jgi:hypothetical protein
LLGNKVVQFGDGSVVPVPFEEPLPFNNMPVQ